MGKAYLYSDFVAANGDTTNLADKTAEYNEVMRSPARITQFLVYKSNSDFVPGQDIDMVSLTFNVAPELTVKCLSDDLNIQVEEEAFGFLMRYNFLIPDYLSYNISFDIMLNGTTKTFDEILNLSTTSPITFTVSTISSTIKRVTITKIVTGGGIVATVKDETPETKTITVIRNNGVGVMLKNKDLTAKVSGNKYIITVPADYFEQGGVSIDIYAYYNASNYEPYLISVEGAIYGEGSEGKNIHCFITSITSQNCTVTFGVQPRASANNSDEGEITTDSIGESTWNDLSVVYGAYWEQNADTFVSRLTLYNNQSTGALEFPFYRDSDYRFFFADETTLETVYPSYVYIRTIDNGNELKTTNTERADNRYTKYNLTADDDGAVVWSNSPWSEAFHGKYLRMCFSGFPDGCIPVLLGAQAYYDKDNVHPDADSDELTGMYFDGNSIISVDITLDSDVMGQSLPYSSFSIVVNDERDMFNPMVRNNTSSTFVKYQDFDFYTLSRNADVEPETFYITKIGRAKLNDIQHSNTTATLSFIGLMEYYDNIFLSELELYWSNHFYLLNLKEYLELLFGSDIDPETLTRFENEAIITPFKEESKAEILRIIAEYYCGYVYENDNGKLAVMINGNNQFYMDKDSSGNSIPYEILLDLQRNNPDYTQTREVPDTYSIVCHKYQSSEDEIEITDKNGGHILIEIYQKNIGQSDFEYIGSEAAYGGNDENVYISNDSEWYQNFLQNENADYLKFRLRFDNSYDLSTIRVSSLFGESYFTHFDVYYGGASAYTSLRNVYDFANYSIKSNDSSNGLFTYCENYIDIQLRKGAVLKSVADINENDEPLTTNEDLVYGLVFFMLACTYSTYGKTVEDAQFSSIYADNISSVFSEPDITVDNPLLTKQSDVALFYRYYKNWYNNYIYEISTTDWLGNGALTISNKTLCGFTLRTTGTKTYNNYYAGVIQKKSIEYDGGYTEDLTLVSYPQKYYQQEMIINGVETDIDNPVKDNEYIYEEVALKMNSGFKFNMSENINV